MMTINSGSGSASLHYLSSTGADVAAALALSKIRYPNNPFHDGEIQLQIAAGQQDHVMSYAPKFIRSFMPEQHREFYAELPFLVAAAHDGEGHMWATLLETNGTGGANSQSNYNGNNSNVPAVTSPDANTLHIAAHPAPGDALFGAFQEGTAVGLLGIQLETARRNRVNGRITAIQQPPQPRDVGSGNGGGGALMVFTVDQSFGNCPQYIRTRDSWYRTVPTNTAGHRSTQLSRAQMDWIGSAETIFTASGYQGSSSPDVGDQPHETFCGNDASHRGGRAGFVRVVTDIDERNNNGVERQFIVWTEYSGNNHYNTLGNLVLDPRVGIAIPDFENGGLLQVSGTASILHDKQEDTYQVIVKVKLVNEMPPGSLPIRWRKENVDASDGKSSTLVVAKIVQESEHVKSFYLQHADVGKDKNSNDYASKAGQYLPVEITLPNGIEVKRSYSLSAHNEPYYRISVKKEPRGLVSTYLHESIQIGDTLTAGKPAGDFTLEKLDDPGQPTVLLSSGIGVTPVLSILSDKAKGPATNLVWIHGARNGRQHTFKHEVLALTRQARKNGYQVRSRIFYSQPDAEDSGDYDVAGRINLKDIADLVTEPSARYFLCGPPSFIADAREMLENQGVPDTSVHYESF
jgi:uncharacterized protein